MTAPAEIATAPSARARVVYRINAQGEIVFVNGEWDRFALANDANDLVASRIQSRPLWSFIGDPTVKHLYTQIIAAAHSGAQPSFVFRCDAPSVRRFLKMEVTATDDGGTEFRTTTIYAAERPSQKLLNIHVPRSEETLVMCGWCQRVEVDCEWLDVEEAVARLDLFARDNLPMLNHGICLDCYDGMIQAMASP